jgi:putative ABC transport system substrate-binding protein
LAAARATTARATGAAQPESRRYRIGIMEARAVSANAAQLAAFRRGLEELGYVEQRQFVLEYESAEGQPDRFPSIATELVRIPVDVILAPARRPPGRQAGDADDTDRHDVQR